MRFLRTISTSRLLALILAVVVGGAATAAIALAATGGGGPKPPPKPLATAIHDALSAPAVDGVTARITFTNHLVDSSAIPGATPLLSGASGRAWASSDGRVRLELQSDTGDVQVVSDGHRFLIYDGSSNTAYRGSLPRLASQPGRKQGGPPSIAEITKSLAQAQQRLTLSGAIPTTVAGQPAYQVRVRPLHGGLVSGARLAWDAVRGVPLGLAVYARGNGSPVLALTARSISYGAVPASTFAITPPKGAKLVDLNLGTGAGAGSSKQAPVSGLGAVRRALPFQLAAPPRLAGRGRAQVKLIGHDGTALVTYGQGLDGLAVIEQQAHGQSQSSPGGTQLPSVTIGGATGEELSTALGTAVRFTRNGVEYTVLGSHASGVVIAAARAL